MVSPVQVAKRLSAKTQIDQLQIVKELVTELMDFLVVRDDLS